MYMNIVKIIGDIEMINLLEETIDKIKQIGLNISDINEYYMSITPPDNNNDYDPDKTVLIYGTGENLINESVINIDYEENLEFQMVEGWISFKDGSWIERDSEYQDEDDRREDNSIYEYWVHNKCPKISDCIKGYQIV